MESVDSFDYQSYMKQKGSKEFKFTICFWFITFNI